jgi:hypothetical protein
MSRGRNLAEEMDQLKALITKLTIRVEQLERENTAWRDAFSRGSLPPPRPVSAH